MIDFIKYLIGSKKKYGGKVFEADQKQTGEKSNFQKIVEEVEQERAGFIDEETGKTYKTEAALKAAKTRRKNKKGKK